jgi:hypothetical protein
VAVAAEVVVALPEVICRPDRPPLCPRRLTAPGLMSQIAVKSTAYIQETTFLAD